MADVKLKIDQLLHDAAPFIAPGATLSGHPTLVPRLTIWTSPVATPAVAAVFEPMFYAVLQGTKVLTMGENRFAMSPGQCAASSSGMPYSHQLIGISPDVPYVGISLHLDADRLTRVALEMPRTEERWTCAVAAGDLGGSVGDAFSRLVGLVAVPDDINVLAPLYEAELYYRLLQSPMGDTLRQIVQRDDRIRQIKAAADWLGVHNNEPVAINDMAAAAGMSVTSFYRHFKTVTGYSPLSFQRQMRLLEAHKLLVAGGTSVGRVAFDVGYQSLSQFSREYKNKFGKSPLTDMKR